MSVTPLLACRCCGAETQSIAQFTGLIEATVPLCDRCYEDARTGAADLRAQFEALLAGGMTREQANAVMIARIDGVAPA